MSWPKVSVPKRADFAAWPVWPQEIRHVAVILIGFVRSLLSFEIRERERVLSKRWLLAAPPWAPPPAG